MYTYRYIYVYVYRYRYIYIHLHQMSHRDGDANCRHSTRSREHALSLPLYRRMHLSHISIPFQGSASRSLCLLWYAHTPKHTLLLRLCAQSLSLSFSLSSHTPKHTLSLHLCAQSLSFSFSLSYAHAHVPAHGDINIGLEVPTLFWDLTRNLY